jgi:hypothetical protein
VVTRRIAKIPRRPRLELDRGWTKDVRCGRRACLCPAITGSETIADAASASLCCFIGVHGYATARTKRDGTVHVRRLSLRHGRVGRVRPYAVEVGVTNEGEITSVRPLRFADLLNEVCAFALER